MAAPARIVASARPISGAIGARGPVSGSATGALGPAEVNATGALGPPAAATATLNRSVKSTLAMPAAGTVTLGRASVAWTVTSVGVPVNDLGNQARRTAADVGEHLRYGAAGWPAGITRAKTWTAAAAYRQDADAALLPSARTGESLDHLDRRRQSVSTCR